MVEHSHNHNHQEGDDHSHHNPEGHHDENAPHKEQHAAHSKLKKHASALESKLVSVFSNAPHLPENWQNFIVKYIPILSLIFGLLGVIGLLGSGAMGTLLSPFVVLGRGFFGILLLLTLVISLVTAILAILAYKPLKHKKKIGWDYLFYALVISAASTLLSVISMYGGFGSLIMIIISSYVIFEIRERYH